MNNRILRIALAAFAFAALSPCAAAAAKQVMVVPIRDEIQLGIAPFVERATRQANQSGFDLIIYEINTFGGRLDAAVTIRDAIINSRVRTIAFIDKRAISAGVLIALAADRIYMHPQSTMGAAEPVSMGIGGGAGETSEKVVSYWRTELRSTAEKNNRRGDLAEAFADKSVVIPGVNEEGKLLSLSTRQALELGMADGSAETIGDVLALEGLEGADISRASMNPAERTAGFLTKALVSSLLMTIAIVGIFVEIKTPGFGVPGIVALVALSLFFGSHYLVNLAGWGEIILFVFGVAMLLVEIFLIPGFGVVGTIGILSIVSSLYLSLIGRFVHIDDFLDGAKILAFSFIVSFGIILLFLRFLPKFAPFQRLVLKIEETAVAGFSSSPEYLATLVGREGTAITVLRPAGTALIDGNPISVVTEGSFIEKDTRLRVKQVEGYRVVVEKV
jgi:membrane-bound serine protease (ClpP class)